MPGTLSHADVERLVADPSAEARSVLAGKLGEEMTEAGLAPGELALAQDIVRVLARDVEVAVRTALATSVRGARDLPHDVAVRLAQDVEAVALPILADSLVLTDDDLVALVRQGSPRKQEIIAARPALMEPVADALIDHAGETAVATLMANSTARIADASLEKAVTRFAGSEPVKTRMVQRASLPIQVAERLTALVSRQLQDHLVRNHALPPSLASDLVIQGRERAVIRLSAGSDEPNLLRMVAQMHHSGRLTPSLVLRAVCTGDIGFFEAALAELASIPINNARVLIHDPGGRGLLSLYHKARLPDSWFPAVRAAVDAVDDTPLDGQERDLERFRTRVMTRVLTQTETMAGDDADYLVGKLGEFLRAA